MLALIELAKFGFESFIDRNDGDWLVWHGDIPYFDSQKVSSSQVFLVFEEGETGVARDNISEEVLGDWTVVSEVDCSIVAQC